MLFRDNPPRQEETIRRKGDDRTSCSGSSSARDGEIPLQKGVVSGIQLEAVLRQLSKVQGSKRFDQLPIPFRAVATDP